LPTVTEIFPVVAPVGTVVAILVAVLEVTVAAVPLNFTVLFAGVVSKLVPVMVTASPTIPLVGLKLVIEGGGPVTVKVELVPVRLATVTVIAPVVAPAGTEVVILVGVLAVTTVTRVETGNGGCYNKTRTACSSLTSDRYGDCACGCACGNGSSNAGGGAGRN
jgi:hypothetical protein